MEPIQKCKQLLKLLVGIMPSGAITFVLKLYGHSILDLPMNKSGFITKIEQGYDIMAILAQFADIFRTYNYFNYMWLYIYYMWLYIYVGSTALHWASDEGEAD